MIVKNIFWSLLLLRGHNFLGSWKYTKETHGNCELQVSVKIGLIQVEVNRCFVLQYDTIILEYIVDILTFEFCGGMR